MPARVVTREELMARVWDENWFGSTKTLDVHIGWLRRKLGDDAAAPRYMHTVRGVGFRFGAPEDDAQRGGGAVSLRAALLLALAYVLVLAIVALEVPLGLSLRATASTTRCARRRARRPTSSRPPPRTCSRPSHRGDCSALVDPIGRRPCAGA